MTAYSYTPMQAGHALSVVLSLMKQYRFFLATQDGARDDTGAFSSEPLDPHVFGPAIVLDRTIRNVYNTARLHAEEAILATERSLEIAHADLSGNKQLVQCNRYTGGFDICQVFPLSVFAEYLPHSRAEITDTCLQTLLQKKTADDIPPKLMRTYKERAHSLANTIWAQMDLMDLRSGRNNPQCVVLMKTRFDCDGSDNNGDFMLSKTRDMQEFPHALGYLFYKHALKSRIVPHSHIVFSTSRESHVNLQQWRTAPAPTIYFEASAGYSCPVYFATVL